MATKPVLSSSETKLLYALMDAAEIDGLLRKTAFEARWLSLKRSAEPLFAKLDRGDLYLLVGDIVAANLLKNSWMEERWLAVEQRVQTEPMMASASQSLFPPANVG